MKGQNKQMVALTKQCKIPFQSAERPFLAPIPCLVLSCHLLIYAFKGFCFFSSTQEHARLLRVDTDTRTYMNITAKQQHHLPAIHVDELIEVFYICAVLQIIMMAVCLARHEALTILFAPSLISALQTGPIATIYRSVCLHTDRSHYDV